MTWLNLEGRWEEFAGSARAHWSELTDEDAQAVAGNREQLIARIEELYGIGHEAAVRQVDEWSDGLLDIVAPLQGK